VLPTGTCLLQDGKPAKNVKVLSDSVLTVDPKRSTAITGFGLTQTYDLLRNGIMPSIVIGRRYYIPKAALLRWLDNCGR